MGLAMNKALKLFVSCCMGCYIRRYGIPSEHERNTVIQAATNAPNNWTAEDVINSVQFSTVQRSSRENNSKKVGRGH